MIYLRVNIMSFVIYLAVIVLIIVLVFTRYCQYTNSRVRTPVDTSVPADTGVHVQLPTSVIRDPGLPVDMDYYPETFTGQVELDTINSAQTPTITDNTDYGAVVAKIGISADMRKQHSDYMTRNSGKFLIASQHGQLEDQDQVPQHGLRTYTCQNMREDPTARQVSGVDINNTFCRSLKVTDNTIRGVAV